MNTFYKLLSVISLLTFFGLRTNAQCDTLRNWTPGINFSWVTSASGYIPGHTTDGFENILEFAEPYSANPSDSIKRILVAPYIVENNDGSEVTFKIYEDNGGFPGNTLTSEVVDFNNLQAGLFNIVNLSNPVIVPASGNFFAGFEITYSNANDTLGLFSQYNEPGATNTLFIRTITHGWEDATDAFGPVTINSALSILVSPSDVPEPDFVSLTTLSICDGANFEVDADGHAQNMTQYNWELWTWDPIAGEIIDLIDQSSGSPQASLTPDGVGEYAIALFSQENCSFEGILYSGFEVLPEFEYDLTVIDESCIGSDGSITLDNFSGGSGDYVYSWSVPYFLYNNPPHDTINLEAGTYNLSFGSVNLDGSNFNFLSGCEVTETINLQQISGEQITVDPNTEICQGNSTTINASGNGTIEWFASGVSQGTGPSLVVSPFSTASYQAVLTDANGCTDSDFITVTVNNENANFNFNNFCEGSPNNSPTNISTAGGTFSLITGTTGSGTVKPSTGEISGAIEGDVYEVQYEITGNCPDAVSVTVNITASDDPSFAFSTPCENIAILPTNVSTPNGTWSLGTGSAAGASIDPNSGEITGVSTGDNVVVIYETPAGACQSSETNSIVIFNAPTIVASSSTTEACVGEQVNLEATGADTYTWDSGIGAGSNPTITVSATNTYTVTGTDANGCQGTDNVTIIANPLPTVDAGSNVTVCEGDEVILEASVQPGVNISWDGGIIDGEAFVPGLGVTTYEVTAIDGNNCQNTDEVVVTVNSGPMATINQVDQTFCINDDAILLSANPSGGTFSGNGINGNEFSPSDAGLGQHEIIYTVQDLSGCPGETSVVFTVIEEEKCFLNTLDDNPLSNLVLMPNPASEFVNIVSTNGAKIDKVEIISVTGQVINNRFLFENNGVYKVNLSGTQKGAYFIRITAENLQTTRKIIVK